MYIKIYMGFPLSSIPEQEGYENIIGDWSLSTASAIYVRVPQELLKEFDRVAQEHGLSRSEAIREAMKLFIYYSKAPDVKKLRGIIETKVEADELDKFILPG
ncbi:hypothetical protein Pyrde_1586 [Pyrodictium delaneyi]|uniref:Ribbon-helix-helix protein CopG domain-containing protein n=1 Tax=Pyrodictium delaneyi TaxID=1273541 RepID=A0A0P0N4E0_9CREN|nr:hypothetical protein Pyrde_1586 [Pyrodictium delaneyi]OWJ55135.1 hypothetical protein Pdsh_05490 [Pyrodictium delaneyi]